MRKKRHAEDDLGWSDDDDDAAAGTQSNIMYVDTFEVVCFPHN